MRRLVAIVVVLALLVLGAGAVGVLAASWYGDAERTPATPAPSPRSSSSATPPAAGATDAPARRLQRFYSQTLEWSSCEASFECAELRVPLDYAEPGGRTIELALLKVPATGERIGSLVVNPGGPGAPGTDYAAAAGRVFRQPLLRGFDIVGFDARGTGESSPVDCLSDADLDEFLAADPDPDDAAEALEYARQMRALGAGCRRLSGDLAAHVSTVEAARDMDVLRAALGEARLAYFGASYGTKLGATFAELFPDRVGRFVLDGAVDVSLTTRQLALEQAAGFETALRSYVADCVRTTDNCFLGDSVEEGLATIDGLLAEIEASPLPTGSGRELRVGNAFYGVVAPLYNRDYWFLLSAALKAALEGKGDALLQLSDLYTSRGPEGYTDNSAEALFAIMCLDDPTAIDFDEVEAQYAAFEAASPTFGRIFAWSLTGCRGSRVRGASEPLEIDGAGAAPILVVGTTRDPATPVEWAEALAAQLESGVLLRRDGDGHTAYNSGNECVDTAIEDYLLSGTVPKDPTHC